MSWTNVPFKNPGDPVTAENWNGLVGNFAAVADAEPGAPKILVPEALHTTETDPFALLHADGAGGTRWNRPSLEVRTGLGVVDGLAMGTWVVWAMAGMPPQSDDLGEFHYGQALIVGGALTNWMVFKNGFFAFAGFTLDAGRLEFLDDGGGAPPRRNRWITAIRVG
jgi:hypothetical protein